MKGSGVGALTARIQQQQQQQRGLCKCGCGLLLAQCPQLKLYGCREWVSFLGRFGGRRFQLPASPLSGKMMVIVEPRCHPFLPLVIANFATQLCPLGWSLLVVHGENRKWLESHPAFRPSNPECVKWMDLGKPNLTISGYNSLFLDRRFWRRIYDLGGREALIFQTDTLLLDGARLDAEYANDRYDYVGAPWVRIYCGARVGNGGLSLRSVSKMMQYCKTIYEADSAPGQLGSVLAHFRNEDVQFAIVASCDPSGRVPDVGVASGFSAETLLLDPNPCGLHKPTCNRDAVLSLLVRSDDRRSS